MWFPLLPAILPKWAGHHPWKDMQSMAYNTTEENPPSSINPQRELLSYWLQTYWFGPSWRLVNSFPMHSAGWCITRSKLITCWWQESQIQIHATVCVFMHFPMLLSQAKQQISLLRLFMGKKKKRTASLLNKCISTVLLCSLLLLDLLWQSSVWDTNHCQQTDSRRCRRQAKNHAQDLSFSNSMGNYSPYSNQKN